MGIEDEYEYDDKKGVADDEDDDQDEEDDDDELAQWGGNKRSYYDERRSGEDLNEDAAREEEEEHDRDYRRVFGISALTDDYEEVTDEFRYLVLPEETRKALKAYDYRWVVFRVADRVLLIDLSLMEEKDIFHLK